MNVLDREPDLATARLWLRRWRDDDRDKFAHMNADPEVMRYFPALLTRAESDALIDRFEQHFVQHGFGLWALEIPGVISLAGFVGLKVVDFDAPFCPAVEIGWRMQRAYWGQGYATEAAEAVLTHAFDDLHLDHIVSFTTRENQRSRAVMERIGMVRNEADDFEHPLLPQGHRQRPHVLYRIERPL